MHGAQHIKFIGIFLTIKGILYKCSLWFSAAFVKFVNIFIAGRSQMWYLLLCHDFNSTYSGRFLMWKQIQLTSLHVLSTRVLRKHL
jgi:hypothetical protein